MTHHRPNPEKPSAGAVHLAEAVTRAMLCQEFIRLTGPAGLGVVAAAGVLGRPASFFSGKESALARYHRDGVAAFLRSRREWSYPSSPLTREIEALPWFIPAARWFYFALAGARKHRAFARAIQRTLALPQLPRGWSRVTRDRFLDALGLPAVPVCPTELRETITTRARHRKPLVTDRVARKIVSPGTQSQKPTETLQLAATLVELLRQFPAEVVTAHLALLRSSGPSASTTPRLLAQHAPPNKKAPPLAADANCSLPCCPRSASRRKCFVQARKAGDYAN